MKLKVVNKGKFFRAILTIVFIIMFLLAFTINVTYSKGEITYKEEYILAGDTLWSIAKKEVENNKYYHNKDIRQIVREIKLLNNIENENLQIGQTIVIPTF